MTLRDLALACLLIATLTVAGLAVYGFQAWQTHLQGRGDLQRIDRIQHEMHRLGAAINYTTLLRLEASVLEEMARSTRDIDSRLQEFEHPDTIVSTEHLAEIRHIVDKLLVWRLQMEAMEQTQRLDLTTMLARQLRIHYAGAAESLEAFAAHRFDQHSRALYRGLITFVAASVVFAIAVLFAFLIMHRRLSRPLRAISQGVAEFGRGNLDTRIAVDSTDELGQLAASFNEMARQRQQHESELADSEARFRQIAESIGECFWLAEPDNSRIIYLSPAYEEIWGHSREAVYEDASLWTSAIHEDDKAHVREALKRHPQGEYQAEFRVVHPDGTVRWVSDRSSAVRDEQGNIIRIAGVARDITERRNYQLALNERIKELRCIYQVLQLTTSRELDVDEILKSIADLLPPSLLHAADAVASVLVDGQEFRSAGWSKPRSELSSPIRIDGREEGAVTIGYCSDKPDQHGGEGPFLAEERDLIESVGVHVARMIKDRRMAETLTRSERLKAVGELTGGVAHDFNNLLTVILGNAELLQEELEANAPQLAIMANLIGTAAQRGADLTQRLLAFARRQVLEPRAVDINELVVDMETLLRQALGETIDLQLQAGDEIEPAMVDPVQFESAVLNLCLNARDAMPQGGTLTLEIRMVTLDRADVSLYEDISPGQYVRLSVTDTGKGINARNIERVFEPFYTTREDGTGLGLSMVYGLVKQSRGHIYIYSEPGVGTSVKILLPVAVSSESEVDADAESAASGGGSESILVVEDNELVRQFATDRLRDLGYDVVVAGSAPEALEVLNGDKRFELLFTDIVMPGGMNGKELVEKARELQPDIRVLFTSGYTENTLVHHGRLDAGVDLLNKPYRRTELERRVREVLDRK